MCPLAVQFHRYIVAPYRNNKNKPDEEEGPTVSVFMQKEWVKS
jgi:hypothetical protein